MRIDDPDAGGLAGHFMATITCGCQKDATLVTAIVHAEFARGLDDGRWAESHSAGAERQRIDPV